MNTKKPLTAAEQQIATMDAMGYAIGRAAPLLAQFPPTDFQAAGYTLLKLDHLYNELLATPREGMLHLTQAAIVNGMMTGISDWQRTQAN